MWAQYVCSREQRIVLYKWSSINQSKNIACVKSYVSSIHQIMQKSIHTQWYRKAYTHSGTKKHAHTVAQKSRHTQWHKKAGTHSGTKRHTHTVVKKHTHTMVEKSIHTQSHKKAYKKGILCLFQYIRQSHKAQWNKNWLLKPPSPPPLPPGINFGTVQNVGFSSMFQVFTRQGLKTVYFLFQKWTMQ